MSKPKFKITAQYMSGHEQSATYCTLKALKYATHITLMQDMRGVKKVTIENLQEEQKSDD